MRIKKNGRTIKLSESDLKRITKYYLNEESFMGGNENVELSEDDMINIIADFFSTQVLNGSLSETEEDLGSRGSKFAEKAMMGGGLGTALTGAIGSLGEIKGWSDFKITSMIHDYMETLGMGSYTGPVTIAMVAAGLAIALAGRAKKYSRTGN